MLRLTVNTARLRVMFRATPNTHSGPTLVASQASLIFLVDSSVELVQRRHVLLVDQIELQSTNEQLLATSDVMPVRRKPCQPVPYLGYEQVEVSVICVQMGCMRSRR